MSRATASLAMQLAAANQRLFDLRQRAQQIAPSTPLQVDEARWNRPNSAVTCVSGWFQPKTQVTARTKPPKSTQQRAPTANSTIPFFPDIGLALLRQSHEATARIWLLLRHCDAQGKGWVAVDEARALLTVKGEVLRVCGWRQLRNLLRAGQGIFWQRDQERIWLRSTAKVAAALGIERVENRPIALPIKALLGGIGTIRAHFYASFHSGRHTDRQSKPIARATLTALSGVGRDSQRSYERQASIAVQPNFALGQVATLQARQTACWQIGQHVFTLDDRTGNYGKPGASYLAWQLPNSYAGVHNQQPRRQRRRINRQLADLLNQGTTGNDKPATMQRYFHSGSSKKTLQQTAALTYWHDLSSQKTSACMWGIANAMNIG